MSIQKYKLGHSKVKMGMVNDSLTTDLGGLKFGHDTNGNYGYYKVGADTLSPFNSKLVFPRVFQSNYGQSDYYTYVEITNNGYTTISGTFNYNLIIRLDITITGDGKQIFNYHDSTTWQSGVKDFSANILGYKDIILRFGEIDGMSSGRGCNLTNLILS